MTEACGNSYVLNNPLRYTDPSGYITQEMYMLAQRIIANLDSYDDVNLTIGGGDISGTINGIMVDYSGLSLDGSAAYDLWHALGGKSSGIIPLSSGDRNVANQDKAYWIKYFTRFSGNWIEPVTIVASNFQSQGDFSVSINFNGVKQLQTSWCAFATGEGIHAYYGKTKTQTQIANEYYSAQNIPQNSNIAAYWVEHMQKFYKYTGIGTRTTIPTVDDIRTYLANGNPILSRVDFGNGGHAIVITGIYSVGGNIGITYFDPDPSRGNSLNMSYNAFSGYQLQTAVILGIK